MDPLTWAFIGSALAGLGATVWQTNEQNNQNEIAYQRQLQAQNEMRKYNSIEETVKRMKGVGLNPYNAISGSTGVQTSMVQVPTAQVPTLDFSSISGALFESAKTNNAMNQAKMAGIKADQMAEIFVNELGLSTVELERARSEKDMVLRENKIWEELDRITKTDKSFSPTLMKFLGTVIRQLGKLK